MTWPVHFFANFALSLVSIQVGIQPFLTEKYISRTAIKSSLVVIQELVKALCCVTILLITGNHFHILSSWSLQSSLRVALTPAIIYFIQNILAYYAYLQLDPLTFNLINQSKIIFGAVFLKLLLNKTQTTRQIIALFILFISALVLTVDTTSSAHIHSDSERNTMFGLSALIIASISSGLAGTLTQKALQAETAPRNSLLFTIELALYGILFCGCSLYIEYKLNILDGPLVAHYGFFDQMDIHVLIPITLNGIGGITVGVITKYTSVIHKSYAMICGILLTAMFRCIMYSVPMSNAMYIVIPMVMCSLWLNVDSNKFKKEYNKSN
eukprot:297596_1